MSDSSYLTGSRRATGPTGRLAASECGSALIEYALLLGAIVCAVIAGFHFSGDFGIPAFDLNRALAESKTPTTSPGLPVVGRPNRGNGQFEGATSQEIHLPQAGHFGAWVFAVAAVIGLGLFGTFRLRRRSRGSSAADKESIGHAEDRLHAKRQVLWKNILNDPRLLFKNRVEVRHLMTRDVSVVPRRTATGEIRRLMTEKHMHHVLVCDSDGRLEGVVSDRDLCSDQATTAADIMTAKPITVRPDTTASAAIATLLEHQISCVPVVEDDCLRGILTRTDLLVSLQCMLQWWLRFAQTLARAAECSDTIDGVQEANGRRLFEQRVRLQSLSRSLGTNGKPSEATDWESFANEAEAFLATAGELIAMQTFEGDRLSQMAGELLDITKS